MKKLLLLLFICPLIFSGCVRVEEKISIHDDNTADVSSAFLMDSRLAEIAGMDPFDESISEMKKTPGVTVQKIEKDGYSGVEVVNKIKNIEKDDIKPVAKEIKLLNKDGRVLSVEKGFFVNTYTINMDYDMSTMKVEQGMTREKADSFMKSSMSIQIPRKAKKNNATTVNDTNNTYDWTMKLFDHNPVQLSYEKYNYFNITATALGVILLLFLIPLFIGDKKKEEE